MTTFATHGISTDEVFSPGYVTFDCAVWNLPDNSMGRIGRHIVFRPLATHKGYRGHEAVTDEMREAVQAHYAAELAAEAQVEAARREVEKAKHGAFMDAVALIEALPDAARAEMAAAQRQHARTWIGINEGGEGYVPEIGWHTEIGRQIAARHGLDVERIAQAGKVLAE